MGWRGGCRDCWWRDWYSGLLSGLQFEEKDCEVRRGFQYSSPLQLIRMELFMSKHFQP
jgi:hypothetical protein